MADFAASLRDGLTLAASSVAGDHRFGRAARDAAGDVLLESDLIPTMQAAVSLLLRLEEQEAAAKAAAERLKAALVEALDATTGSIKAGIHTASVVNGRPSAVITDDAAIPAEYMETPPPRPDKARIARALANGIAVPGAVLRNGAPYLRIATNVQKDNAA